MANKHINNKSFSIGCIEIVKKYEKKLVLQLFLIVLIMCINNCPAYFPRGFSFLLVLSS